MRIGNPYDGTFIPNLPTTVWEPPSSIPQPTIPPPVTIFSDVMRADIEALRSDLAELEALCKEIKELLMERSK